MSEDDNNFDLINIYDKDNIFDNTVVLGCFEEIESDMLLLIYSDCSELYSNAFKTKSNNISPYKQRFLSKLATPKKQIDVSYLKIAKLDLNNQKWKKIDYNDEYSKLNEDEIIIPSARIHFKTFLISNQKNDSKSNNSNILVIGGEDINGMCSDSYLLNTSTFIWTKIKDSNFSPRKHFSLSSINKYAIGYGGVVNSKSKGVDFSKENVSSDLFFINENEFLIHQITDDENLIRDDPGNLYGHSSVLVGEELFIFGGINVYKEDIDKIDEDNLAKNNFTNETPRKMKTNPSTSTTDYTSELSNKLYSFNISTLEWNLLLTDGSIPEPRAFHSTCKINDNSFIVYGGSPYELNQMVIQNFSYNDFKLFNIVDNIWFNIQLQNNISTKMLHCCFSTKAENVIVFGGLNNINDVVDNEELNINVNYDNSVIGNSSLVWYLKFKEEEKITYKNYEIDFDNKDFNKEEFMNNSEETINEIKDRVSIMKEIINNTENKINEINEDIEKKKEDNKKTDELGKTEDHLDNNNNNKREDMSINDQLFIDFNIVEKNIINKKNIYSNLLKEKVKGIMSFSQYVNLLNKDLLMSLDTVKHSKLMK